MDSELAYGNPTRTGHAETTLSLGIAHYNSIVISLSETIRLIAEIEYVIEAHGSWQGPFQTKE